MSVRRMKGIYIAPEMMYQILHGWKKDGSVDLFSLDWPTDTQFISTNWVAERRAFLMVFEHELFEIVPEGDLIPINCPYVEKVNIPSEILKEAK